MSVRGLYLKYLLILSDCECNTVKSFKGFSESLNLTLNYCNQDSVQVLIGKCHGKCF